ncbi:avidin/streptavidin family protein [Photobacterium profundum]|uniref:avidin/streptavidin family protein n=1 Tax=Photobacterium profundum TaxID=74109 RepID=UPI003D104AE1
MHIDKYLNENKKVSSQVSNVSFEGVWRNRLDSEMELFLDTSGNLQGVYRTGVGSPSPKEEFDLKGYVSGDLIVFCVDFGKYGSLTSWAGQHTRDNNGNEVIYTLWHLAQNISDDKEPDELWAGIIAGANEYRRN